MRIKYPQAIRESEETLAKLEQRLRGQKPADRVRMLRLLKSGTVNSLKECAPLVGYSVGQLTRLPGMLPGSGLGRITQAAQASRKALTADSRGVGCFDASDASRAHRDHGRCTRLPGARVGDSVQERQVALVALQETSSACGRPGAGGTRKPMPSSRQPLKKLREPGQAPSPEASCGYG
jgi:hypothetical protein